MALKCLVKISSVNNLSDARYTAGMGVELMGFDLNPDSDNFVSPDQFSAITSWVSGVKYVGEFDHYSAELLAPYSLDYVQLNHKVPVATVLSCPLPVIIRIDQTNKASIKEVLDKFSAQPAWFLLEPNQDISGELLSWCTQMAARYPIILGTNLNKENVNQLANVGYKGFALRGGNEIRPGFKNFDDLADILEALEVEL